MAVLEVTINQAGYQDEETVIKDICFSVNEGELVGLIGANGAGKSTTIKAILGLLKNMKGETDFNGKTNTYAYIPEQPVYYDELTLWEHLELAASIMELDFHDFEKRANYFLGKFHLQEVKHQLPQGFSKGMQQKIMIVLAFLIDPDLYIIDEPFIGLDPIAIKDLLDLLVEEKNNGKGILITTHVLDTAEKICDRFVIIHQGKTISTGTLEEIKDKSGNSSNALLDIFYEMVGRI